MIHPILKILDRIAGAVIGAGRTVARRKNLVSGIGLVVLLVASGGFVLIDSLRINPLRSTMTVYVELAQSGGLLPDQDVTYRGVAVGRVSGVELSGDRVTAVAAIDTRARIPLNSRVRVSGLSPAGEQFLDFRPTTADGPYLTDNAVISEGQTSVPVSLSELLDNGHGMMAQLKPEKLEVISTELRVSRYGPEKLAQIIDGSAFLISTLHEVLPQTVSVMRQSPIVLATLNDKTPGLRQTGANLGGILDGVNRMDGGYRRLLDTGPGALDQVDALINDNSETMVALLGNLTTVAELSYLRVPALQALFPDQSVRGSTLDALSSAFHDKGVWAVGNIWPRYACDYNLPQSPPSSADHNEPHKYTYCANDDPAVLVRGARNAPRPPGDDTAGPPAGYDPLETTEPSPQLPLSIPLPYGGPMLPAAPPPP